jgi:uncharacterized cysteine cluster protein YcgN (CxxCxxCC family)
MGWIVPTQQVCPHLKHNAQENNFYCDVYEKRFEVCGWCHPIEDAIKEGSVPNDCGYVIGTDYKSKLNENIHINPEK